MDIINEYYFKIRGSSTSGGGGGESGGGYDNPIIVTSEEQLNSMLDNMDYQGKVIYCPNKIGNYEEGYYLIKVNQETPDSSTSIKFSDGTEFKCLEVEARKRDDSNSPQIYDLYASNSDCNILLGAGYKYAKLGMTEMDFEDREISNSTYLTIQSDPYSYYYKLYNGEKIGTGNVSGLSGATNHIITLAHFKIGTFEYILPITISLEISTDSPLNAIEFTKQATDENSIFSPGEVINIPIGTFVGSTTSEYINSNNFYDALIKKPYIAKDTILKIREDGVKDE